MCAPLCSWGWVGCPFLDPASLVSRFKSYPQSSECPVEKEMFTFPRTPEPSLSSQAADAVGEILLSLSYLPTAERLTVVVVKAKNLIWTNDKTTAGEGPCAQHLHEARG